MDGRWNSRRNLLAAAAALLFLRCSETPTAVQQAPDPAVFGVVGDTAGFNLLANAAPPVIGPFPLYIGDSATFTVAAPPDCTGGPNGTLNAFGSLTALVFQGPCTLQVGASVTIGPANHWFEFLTLTNVHPTYGYGPFGYSGSYPDFVVYAEDGHTDVDWDDIVLTCHVIECPFFSQPTGDPILDDIRVQRELKKYWYLTQYGIPWNFRRENAAWIVQTQGNPSSPRRVIQYDYRAQEVCRADADPTQFSRIQNQGDTILAAFHTHGLMGVSPNWLSFTMPNPSPCARYAPGEVLRIGDGPSGSVLPGGGLTGDRGWVGFYKTTHYIIDRHHVHKITWDAPALATRDTTFNRNLACVYQQGGVT